MTAGGTELAHAQLIKRLPKDIADKFQIVSRPTDLDPEKPKILWMQDMPGDAPFLAEAHERRKFAGIVFVSSWQQTIFNVNMGVPFSDSVVIKNAIEPIADLSKPDDGIVRLIYHPTPHRGLEILVPVFIELCDKYDNLHLDVFSNFDIYGWPQYNEPFENLYETCRQHPKITYHGTQPNETVRSALQKAHIFAYPCIWRETSCMSAMEAMSAKCLVVAPEYGALAETLANYNHKYNWHEKPQIHAQRFYEAMCSAIDSINSPKTQSKLIKQKEYADEFYSWDTRISEWVSYLSTTSAKPKRKSSITWMDR